MMSEVVGVDYRDQEQFASRLLRDHGLNHHTFDEGLDSLWPGSLLPGWYDDWVVAERDRLDELRVRALEVAAQVLVDRGDLDTALELALMAVRTEPLRESANAMLISIHLARGNTASALRRHNDFRRLLWRELGVSPSEALVRLLPAQCRPQAGHAGMMADPSA